jgi:hypothetical protein
MGLWLLRRIPPGEHKYDHSCYLDRARADFKPRLAGVPVEPDGRRFQSWRDQEAWAAEKYWRFDRRERMPPDCCWGVI